VYKNDNFNFAQKPSIEVVNRIHVEIGRMKGGNLKRYAFLEASKKLTEV